MKEKINIREMRFFKKITQLPFVKRIILYGSRARGDNQPRSDIDIAIDCPEATWQDWLMVTDIIDEADTLLGIDCVRYDQLLNEKLKKYIDIEGIELFRRN